MDGMNELPGALAGLDPKLLAGIEAGVVYKAKAVVTWETESDERASSEFPMHFVPFEVGMASNADLIRYDRLAAALRRLCAGRIDDALVWESDAETFRAQWRAAYEAAFPPKPGALERDFFVMSPGPGAFEL